MEKEQADKIKKIIHKEQERRTWNTLLGMFGLEIQFNVLDFLTDVVDLFVKAK